MKKTNKKAGHFRSFFEKYLDVSKIPFFSLWLTDEFGKILEIESTVTRKGLPKTGPRPMVRGKQLLALLKTIEKLTLKDFAEYFGVSYGVVRLWNREPRVTKKTIEFMILFAADYVQQLEKFVFSKKLDIEKYSLKTTKKAHARINGFLHEAKHYHPIIQEAILDVMSSRANALQSLPLQATLSLLVTILSDHTVFNPPKTKKAKELFEQSIKQSGEFTLKLNKEIFFHLKKMIENGEKQKALTLCDVIEDNMLTRIRDNTDLGIRILNKGRKKEKKKKE